MTTRHFISTVAILVGAFALPAFAKDPPTHHCLKNGAVVTAKKKACAAEGGKWELIPVKAPAGK